MRPKTVVQLAALAVVAAALRASAQDVRPFPCQRSDSACVRTAIQQHPVRHFEHWRELLARPILERVEPAPPAVVEFLTWDNVVNGYPERPRATQASPAFIAEVKAALAALPPDVLVLFDTKLAGIVLVDDLGGTGFTDVVVDEAQRPVAGYVVLDANVLAARTANEWATWKESSPFSPEAGWRLTARIETRAQDSRRNAIQYILLHELGHVLSIGMDVHPPWTVPPREVADANAYPFFGLSWRIDAAGNRYVSHYDEVFPLRRQVTYYFGAKLKASQMRETYSQLSETNYVTLYGATRPGDDFAEAFASYVHVVRMRRPWEIVLEHDGDPPVVFGACWDEPRCADKRRMMDRIAGSK